MGLGIQLKEGGCEFVLYAPQAAQVTLMLFDRAEDETPAREIECACDGDHWHTFVPDAQPGLFYLYRTEAEQQLLDPYAHAVHTPRKWGEKPDVFPKCVIVGDDFDWSGDARPDTPWEQTVIYEAHLRGFTRGAGGGTYLDFIKKIPHLKELGVTAVEFLPLFEFNELEFHLEGNERKELLNLWGYSTRAFFAPMSRYAASPEPGAAITELKQLIKTLHAEGIEVILDVVFNHTAEGPAYWPTCSFRGLADSTYYLKKEDGSYQNWSGCGNTVNANHPVVSRMIVDCLKYWTEEFHIDGFRFDLATALCRGEDGELLEKPPVIVMIETEPALADVKLIAEAWDARGGYQVGHFPGKRFSDWNGKFRDDIRRFWNHHDPIAKLATRLAGSSDLYQHNGGSPLNSINFVTSHDGFTLADLVSYAHKHNEANSERSGDGENHNWSINFGVEGPTRRRDVCSARLRQQKNLLATLLLARGVPMLTAGDEFSRTQQGNNNAYCQDNKISWLDWPLLEKNLELFEFTKKLIKLRAAFPQLHCGTFFTGKDDVQWLGPHGREPDWHHDRALGMLLPCAKVGTHLRGVHGRFGEPSLPEMLLEAKDLLILINNESHSVKFDLPPGDWELELYTSEKPPKHGKLRPHSLAVLSKI